MKRRSWEILAVIIIVILAGMLLWTKANTGSKNVKDSAVIDELRNVRSAVELYLTLNKELPKGMTDLVTEQYEINGVKRFYLEGIKTDDKGYPIDSYGYRFVYDPQSGAVELTTREYEGW